MASPHDSAISLSMPPLPDPKQQDNSDSRKRSSSHFNTEQETGSKRTSSPKSSRPKSRSPPRPLQVSPIDQAAVSDETTAALNQAQEEIEIDSGVDASSSRDFPFSDDGYETDALTSASTSLASSVRNYAFENGRRYHAFREGTYNFPNDEGEQDREDMKHAMMVNLFGGRLHFAPLGKRPQNVLDMGTGTGIWAIEMGDLYPSSNILGVDLSPIQPEWVPPNVKFMVDDVESAWLKPLNHYDYIHARHTVMAIKNWPQLMGRVYDHLKPGGWFELQEIHHIPQCHDNSMPPNHPVCEFWSLITGALSVLGVNFNACLLLEDMMIAAGFINVSVKIFHVPIGLWPKNKVLKLVGLYWRTILIDGLSPIALGPFTRGLKWSREEVEVFLVEVRKAYMEGWVHSHMPCYVIYGQKPE